MTQSKVIEGKTSRELTPSQMMMAMACAVVVSFFMADPALAGAGGFAKATETANEIVVALTALSVIVVTATIMWCGYKIGWGGAKLADVGNILIGGTLIGGAAGFAAWIVN